jgi:dTDP-4-amino-4,6-dideoxygalactose transaminase
MTRPPRIYLSPPHVGDEERRLLLEAFDSNWIAPLGPHVDAFQREFAEFVGAPRAIAVSSGTAALHLALLVAGVGRGDEVVVSTLTFAGSVFPICYLGAHPVLLDSEELSWNLDPDLLEEYLESCAQANRLPKAIVPVHLYGHTANMERIGALGERFGITVIEDAAEALGATFYGKHAGTMAELGIYSFNGNKLLNTSGGGMIVARNPAVLDRVLKLATQAREPVIHYEHNEIGYNYRLSNLLAAVGRGQLRWLEERLRGRETVQQRYAEGFRGVPGIRLQANAGWGRHAYWLSVVELGPAFGASPESVRLSLEAENIEARPIWKPMHLQPVFASERSVLNGVSDRLFGTGLCLPSGSSLTAAQQARVIDCVLAARPA